MSTLKVKIWDTIVGYLHWDQLNSTSIFESSEEYLEAPFNISPILHDKQNSMVYGNTFPEYFQGLPPYLFDSLPDYFGNRVFNEWLLQNDVNQQDLNPVERLMYVGKRGVGALEYYPGKDIPYIEHAVDLDELTQISDLIIKNKYEYKDFLNNPQALQNMLQIGSSVGGAQAKLLVSVNAKGEIKSGDVLQPELNTEYLIIKLAHDTETPWGKEKNFVEFVYNEIARAAGVNVATSKLLKYGKHTHFSSTRFDRVNNQKVHTQTLNALTGYYSRTKPFSYEDAFKYLEILGLDHRQKEQLFLQMVFNVMACNMDDHTKNFSFLMEKSGEWSLSPAYDLTYPFDPYQPQFNEHKILINGKRKNISNEDLLTVAKKIGLRSAQNTINSVKEQVICFSEKCKAFDVSSKTIGLIQKHIEETIKRL